MNYFAHGRAFLDDVPMLIGAAVPDWLNVVARRTRIRSHQVEAFIDDADPYLAGIARGIAQHHFDDNWFHGTTAFALATAETTRAILRALPGDESMRVGFLGHILVELLLDAELIAAAPHELDRYYAACDAIDAERAAAAIERLAGREIEHLATFIPRFAAERFLWDYLDDEKLVYRLNQVMRRVRLEPLPAEFANALPEARKIVAKHREGLLGTRS